MKHFKLTLFPIWLIRKQFLCQFSIFSSCIINICLDLFCMTSNCRSKTIKQIIAKFILHFLWHFYGSTQSAVSSVSYLIRRTCYKEINCKISYENDNVLLYIDFSIFSTIFPFYISIIKLHIGILFVCL